MSTIKRIFILFMFCVTSFFFVTGKSYSEGKNLYFPIGLTYNSTYWWRGVEINGKGAGVLWPKIGAEFSGVTLYVTAGLNKDYGTATESADIKAAKTYHEFDYGIEYARGAGAISSTIGVKYTHYPFYDAAGATVDPSFIEAYAIVSASYFVIPVLELYYDYFVEETNAETPVNEDVYAKLTLFKEIVHADTFTVKTGAWVAYYNNAYLDKKGWSDAGLTFVTSYEHNGVTFFSALNYARSLSKDFYLEYDFDGNGKASTLKNHLWADVGVSSRL
ncbi:MAG TPA: hypothetical protein PLO73_13680 [Spirochaetota bacterium]|nr:hypothetical protein [Spirochaetota bacterium]